ncbi:MAG: alanine racemase [Spirochaetia bacterium]|nr:alanine racemase [Spirochaetia bacterium]MDD7697789.1 alanine racemase [Spirochaetia bacterium]MDY4210492.1 alanine racemase [Treponema sp.]
MELKNIFGNYTTPFYVFDFDKVNERVEEILEKLPDNTKLCYAIKANPFLLHTLRYNKKVLFEVCSEGELQICKKLNLDPEQIVFSGVMKNKKMLIDAVDYGVKVITIESLAHLTDLIAILPQEKVQNIIIRISSGNQFGMEVADFYKAYEQIKDNSNIQIDGIQYFSGTQKKKSKIIEEVNYLEQLIDEVLKNTNLKDLYIEYGPGLSFDYFNKDSSRNYSDLLELSAEISKSKHKYVIEMGRYIASPCGEYYSRICDKKNNNGINYLIIDGGINHINYYGQLMGMKIPPFELLANSLVDDNYDDYCVCGSLCTVADVITKKVTLPRCEIGDYFRFYNIGAYSISEGIYLFLSHDLPMVIAKNKNEYTILRNFQSTYTINC